MGLILIGMNHKTAPVDVREKYAIAEGKYADVIRDLKNVPGVKECVVLSTCNRSEFCCLAEDNVEVERALASFIRNLSPEVGDGISKYLYSHRGRAAVEHLFNVSSSLDSMVVGEPQILGQVKSAYFIAEDSGGTGPIMNRLFRQSFEVGKRVRTETEIGAYAVSVSSLAVELAKKILGNLSGKKGMIIGGGETSELTLKSLVDNGVRDIYVANRTLEKSEELAKEAGGRVVEFSRIEEALAEVDIVISSTGAPHYVLKKMQLQNVMQRRKNRTIFIIDIAVPRDVDPGCAGIYNVFLYNIDDLNAIVTLNREKREREAEKAKSIVAEETLRFERWMEGFQAVPTISLLRSMLSEVKDKELSGLFSQLGTASEREKKLVEDFATSFLNKILHKPTVRLKGSADPGEREKLADAVRYLFDLNDDTEEKK
ncbi:MAG: glutamyl-tRNA reductase [Candidatus Eisenbacteria bacterium]|nr:glutamyl-tRNA reductase [Candidatus Eisenbacteria bacterium]